MNSDLVMTETNLEKRKGKLMASKNDTSPSVDFAIDREKLLELTATAATGYFAANPMPLANVPAVINAFYAALSTADGRATKAWIADRPAPAVAPSESVLEDHIVCLDCGTKLRSLKAHLRSAHGLTPTEYRAKWALPGDYPLVAPAASRRRSEISRRTQMRIQMEGGLGARRGGRSRKMAKPASVI